MIDFTNNNLLKHTYEENFRVYLKQYKINGWKPSVTTLDDFITKVNYTK